MLLQWLVWPFSEPDWESVFLFFFLPVHFSATSTPMQPLRHTWTDVLVESSRANLRSRAANRPADKYETCFIHSLMCYWNAHPVFGEKQKDTGSSLKKNEKNMWRLIQHSMYLRVSFVGDCRDWFGFFHCFYPISSCGVPVMCCWIHKIRTNLSWGLRDQACPCLCRCASSIDKLYSILEMFVGVLTVM